MRVGKSLFSGCKEVNGPEGGWSSQVSGKGVKQKGIIRPSSEMYERFIPILNSKKERNRELEKYGPKSVNDMSEDKADDYDSATDEVEPDEVDTNDESSKKHPKLMLDDSLGQLDDSLSLI